MTERVNREIRRRTRAIGAFPDGNSALMLVCARLRHVAASEWGSKRYMDMEHLFKMEIEQLTAGDTLMAAKLDRIARTAAEGASVIRSLQERGVAVHILNIGILDTSTTGRLMMNVLLAFTEFERDMIVERTQAGREIARTHAGYREGRRPLPKARKDAAVAMVRNGRSYQEACEATGLSRSTVLRAVQAFRAQ